MIIVTGSAGFIGSQIALHFGKKLQSQLICVDSLRDLQSRPYLSSLPKNLILLNEKENFLNELPSLKEVQLVLHMGAITNTAAQDQNELNCWNVNYTKTLWNFCTEKQIPFIYASSAATYGDGKNGFMDDHSKLPLLKPLNLYGLSKHQFDLWALEQKQTPPFWYGLKFFNVYGPHEDHKARMASAIWHGFHEIQKTGKMTLFKSHNPEFKDGEQARDFIFVKDILNIIDFLIFKKPANGIYNCGSGVGESFLNLALELFNALHKKSYAKNDLPIQWIPTPEVFRGAYQYKTVADVSKLKRAGFTQSFTSLKQGVTQYIPYLQCAL